MKHLNLDYIYPSGLANGVKLGAWEGCLKLGTGDLIIKETFFPADLARPMDFNTRWSIQLRFSVDIMENSSKNGT